MPIRAAFFFESSKRIFILCHYHTINGVPISVQTPNIFIIYFSGAFFSVRLFQCGWMQKWIDLFSMSCKIFFFFCVYVHLITGRPRKRHSQGSKKTQTSQFVQVIREREWEKNGRKMNYTLKRFETLRRQRNFGARSLCKLFTFTFRFDISLGSTFFSTERATHCLASNSHYEYFSAAFFIFILFFDQYFLLCFITILCLWALYLSHHFRVITLP